MKTSENEITRESRVEHSRSGQQGTVESVSHSIFGSPRYHVKWDNMEFDTPGGVTADRLIVIKRAQS